MARWRDDTLVGWVYLIGTAERVKVGYTRGHPSVRVGDLQAGSPVVLEELGVIRGTQLIERTVHAYLHEHHWMNEWFHRVPLIDDFIREVAEPWSFAGEDEAEFSTQDATYAAFIAEARDRVIGWFEARGIRPGDGPLRRRDGSVRSFASRSRPVASDLDPSGCPKDHARAMRPDGLLREALKLIAPEWRSAFLRHVRGERVAPGLLPHLVETPGRLAAVESVFAETSDRMRGFAESLEEVIDAIPYSAP